MKGPKGERIGIQTADGLLRWQEALAALNAARTVPLSNEEAERARRWMDEVRMGYAVDMHRARQPNAATLRKDINEISLRMNNLKESIDKMIDRVKYVGSENYMVHIVLVYKAVRSARESLDKYLEAGSVNEIVASEIETRRAYIVKIAEIYRQYAEGSMKPSVDSKGKIAGKFMMFLFEATQLCDNWKAETLRQDWNHLRKSLRVDPAWSGRV